MPQSLANLYARLIFSTKERFPYLTALSSDSRFTRLCALQSCFRA